MSLPMIPPPVLEPEVLPPASEFALEAAKPLKKPQRMTQDVWEVLQEYRQVGGLLDIGEEIASLQGLEVEVRAAQMSEEKRMRLLLDLAEKRGRLKKTHLELLQDKRNFLTLDLFSEFLQELHGVLLKNIGDQYTLQKIGVELASLAIRIHNKMESK